MHFGRVVRYESDMLTVFGSIPRQNRLDGGCAPARSSTESEQCKATQASTVYFLHLVLVT